MFSWIKMIYERYWRKSPPELKKIKVYIWRPFGQNVGHSSMLLQDETYISWWPDGECSQTNFTRPAAPHTSFQEDADIEGNSTPPTFTIKVTDEQMQNIKGWWEEFKSNEENKYIIINNNCSTVIYNALKQAFPELHCFEERVKVWVPVAIQLIAQSLQAEECVFAEENIASIVAKSEDEKTEIAANGGVKRKYLTADKIRKVVDKVEAGAKEVADKKVVKK
ncbi:uncharacterized protein LOC132722109 isoform X2 [Ruditapes philippinarum]|uniref:uncharacterized protein LOC132722109 isoform X2 n=1 Tax=Ruditapes philippinarum TaxID=129788 RepID=UPI00295BF8C5|nr:uncharacterized protein LOC132722109 isoform X2 [Ruditapes philippinarum]